MITYVNTYADRTNIQTHWPIVGGVVVDVRTAILFNRARSAIVNVGGGCGCGIGGCILFYVGELT